MTAYAIWLEERLDLWAPKKRKWWEELEQAVQPSIIDLFAAPPPEQPVHTVRPVDDTRPQIQRLSVKPTPDDIFAPIPMY